MAKSSDSPRVFISYSWKPAANAARVQQIAKRMVSEGVDVILDIWHLREGQDKYHFMEQMVSDPTITRVLLFCNKEYAQKANDRAGGVGTESTIISSEVYGKAEQQKFVAVVMERDEQGVEHLPHFIKSRLYFDLSSDDSFEEEYEKMMRSIYGVPSNVRPALGKKPAYLTAENTVFLPTTHKLTAVKTALQNERTNTPLLIKDFLETVIGLLPQFQIDTSTIKEHNLIDEQVLEVIQQTRPLRDDFVNFTTTYSSLAKKLDADLLVEFFEQLLNVQRSLRPESRDKLGFYADDALRFFCYELALHFSAAMLKLGRFEELRTVLTTEYVVHSPHYNTTSVLGFEELRSPVMVLHQWRKGRLNLQRVNVTADTLIERATGYCTKEDLLQADILLYYTFSLENPKGFRSRMWFPATSCYDLYSLPIMQRATSRRFFEKVKQLFGVETKDELIEKARGVKEQMLGIYYDPPALERGLALDTLATAG